MTATTQSNSPTTVTLVPGDGIGPEVVLAARRIIDASGARITWEDCAAGASVFKQGIATGVPQETIESLNRTRVMLKGPLETPVGYGEKSANVTLRKLFETYGNIRPVREFEGVQTPYSGRGIDLVVVRENVEDLYAGIEHMQTPSVAQCLKLISGPGCEKITRLAFAFAEAEERRMIHCATKSNIMKMTEGLLKRTFERIAPEFPDIEAHHIVVDNCAHQLVKRPEQFDIIMTTNMNGDILSDLTSALVGGLGFAPSANLGTDVAIFEAVHGSAPKYAGLDVANPTAMILSAVMMLRHIGELEAADRIDEAVSMTWAEGNVRTSDVGGDGATSALADEIIANLERSDGSTMRRRKPLVMPIPAADAGVAHPETRQVVGVDIFVESDLDTEVIGDRLTAIAAEGPLKLKMISNRGTKVYEPTGAMTDCVDHWRCRFVGRDDAADISNDQIMALLQKVGAEFGWMHLEKLQEFDGALGYTRAQGED